ncbi:MAG TPA: protoporphyrinogen oxidase [Bryobacteraceae bacterium]|nr:protoporphyrinogen oxidase [Bryobacteraceae bacterium]
MPRVIIVGGGISGLSTAYYLSKRGIPSTIIEQRPRLGGVIQTERVEGCVVEAGPDSFISVKPAAMELIRELGLAGEVIGSNDHLRKTWVRKRGRLVPLPDGLMMIVPTRVMPLAASRLLSWPTKIRMGLELLKSPSPKTEDESVADFVREHYGQEAVDYLAEPLLSGIYGGNPDALSVRAVLPRFVDLATRHGSLTRGVLAERKAARRESSGMPLFRTMKGGLGQLVEAVTGATSGHMEWVRATAEAIEKSGNHYRVRAGGEWLETERVVLACEAHRAAPLAAGIDARISELLGGVAYSSSMTVALGFDEQAFPKPLDGFGFLVPRRERKRLIAATWVGTKFPHRVPPGTALLRCFLGGMENAAILEEQDEMVIAAVVEELREIVPFTSGPRFARVYRWPRSMAQYTVGHPGRMAELESRMSRFPGMALAGNAYQGIGIPDCIRMGRSAAERTAAL